MNKVCELCGKEYEPKKSNQKFCSFDCKTEHYRQKYQIANPNKLNIPKNTVGAISELRVASDLLSKGFQVFRSVSPSCPCDIAVLRGDKLLRLEVKTGHRNTSTGKPYRMPTKSGQFDILALVMPEEIIYQPPIRDTFAILDARLKT